MNLQGSPPGLDQLRNSNSQSASDIQKTLQKALNIEGKGAKAPSERKKKMDKNDFLKLMLTQLKNQDPLKPEKPDKLAVQLAQFASVEQLTNMNQSMEKFTSQSDPLKPMQAANFLGKTITTDGSKISLAEGKGADISFSLEEAAESLKIEVLDKNQSVVKTIEKEGPFQKGEQSIEWDGIRSDGRQAVMGDYQVRIVGFGERGKTIPVDLYEKGTVDGISFQNGKVMLSVGNRQYSMNEVKRIELPQEKLSNSPEQVSERNAQPAKSNLPEGIRKMMENR